MGINCLEIYFYGQLILDKVIKTIPWIRNNLFSNDVGTTGYPHAKETEALPHTIYKK